MSDCNTGFPQWHILSETLQYSLDFYQTKLQLMEVEYRLKLISKVIYQTRATVFHRDIQTPRRELKIRRAVEYF